MIKILIPKALTKFVNEAPYLTLHCARLSDLGSSLQKEYPDFYSILFDDNHQIKSFVAVCLNDKLVRDISKENTLLNNRDTIEILIAISGG